MGEVVWLCRYPVKSMLGEPLATADLTDAGVRGDRRRAVLDESTGLIGSAKQPAKWARLLDMRARWDDDRESARITLPDHAEVTDEGADARLSDVLGRPVRLISDRPEDARLERVTPEGEPTAGDITLSQVAAAGSFADFGAVHLVTTATLAKLGDVDARRFRPNIVVRMLDDLPFAENDWPGREIVIGSKAMLRGVVPTPRCVVPTLAHGPDVPVDRSVIRTAARLNRPQVFNMGAMTCVGAYASVERPGPIAVGDVVRVA